MPRRPRGLSFHRLNGDADAVGDSWCDRRGRIGRGCTSCEGQGRCPRLQAASGNPVSDAPPPLASRLVLGAIAGFVATLPMSIAMRKLHGDLPTKERYPAPPRELIDSVTAQAAPEEPARDLTIAAHHLYGAA